ncbi:hypothetical protein QKU58_gp119 [Pyramimonas orientalis virus]|uniref:Uncharacterized protein n=1 Tax=Pyramimonas orientalis virus 01B TaxID=3134525 RepID=A0A7M3UNF9_9VIRU|nr:hypothetical protein QKU58_gp119 [Pyramimonas orientalis virus]QOI90212.1 hypothetical protein HWQ62_00075 [Pyramimonas orientalis virus]
MIADTKIVFVDKENINQSDEETPFNITDRNQSDEEEDQEEEEMNNSYELTNNVKEGGKRNTNDTITDNTKNINQDDDDIGSVDTADILSDPRNTTYMIAELLKNIHYQLVTLNANVAKNSQN